MIPMNRGYKVGDIARVGVLEQYDKTKKFDKREFIVCIYGATNAFGLFGSEANGILILDKNNKTCVIDEHIVENSGYYGPSEAQIREFDRIMEMKWTDFKDFVNNNPRSRIKIISKNKVEFIYK